MKRKSVVLLALLLAFSCKAERAAPPWRAAVEAATDSAPAAPAPPPASKAAAPQAPAMPRIVIKNAQMTIIVSDAAAVAEKLGALAVSAGGYVSESKEWRESEQLRATLTLRVPAQRLGDTIAAARKLATRVESENVDANDVTQEYVDLDAQVRNLEAAETEMRQLMTTVRERMKKAEDILEVYQHLTELRGQIEQAKGRMRYLSQMAALSTVKIDLVPDAIAKPVVEPGWQPLVVARNASRTLVATLQVLTSAAIWCLIYLLPVVLLLVIVVLVIRTIVRAIRRRPHA